MQVLRPKDLETFHLVCHVTSLSCEASAYDARNPAIYYGIYGYKPTGMCQLVFIAALVMKRGNEPLQYHIIDFKLKKSTLNM